MKEAIKTYDYKMAIAILNGNLRANVTVKAEVMGMKMEKQTLCILAKTEKEFNKLESKYISHESE